MNQKSIIEMLPKVVAEGRREANKILDGLQSNSRVALQTNELVIPNKDALVQTLHNSQQNEQRERFVK